MSQIQKRVVAVFFWLTVLLNLWAALPSFYYAPYRLVGPEVVSAYEPSKDLAPFVPITKIDSSRGINPLVDTGKKVAVSIRNDYQDRKAEKLAKANLILLFVGTMFYLVVADRNTEKPNQAPEPTPPSGASSND